jgi:hypothetical protein
MRLTTVTGLGLAIAASCATLHAQQPAVRTGRPVARLLPGTGPGAFATIQGNALDSADRPIAAATVRLRDVRFGAIAGSDVTDRAGLFVFRPVEPGSYVVELLDPDHRVVATSDILSVNASDSSSTFVKLPARTVPAAAFFTRGGSAALAVLAAAASSGVLATDVTGEDISPR